MREGISLDKSELQHLQNTVPNNIDRVDISEVKLDASTSAKQRALDYIKIVGNPYAFKCGDIAVNVKYNAKGKSLSQAISSYLSAQKNRD